MNDLAKRALLPAGLSDMLPPAAGHEAAVVERLMAVSAARGYERVKPPLVEFEDSLLAGSGVAMAPHTFRLMDPISQRMMGVRADMTLQVARIAATRLVNAPRPLRLSYAGQVLRVRGDDMRPERQVGQVGAELIGSAAAEADAEVVSLAIAALAAVGVTKLDVDLSSPRLVPAILEGLPRSEMDERKLRNALDHKDAGAVATLGGAAAKTLIALLRAAGPADAALAALRRLPLPAAAVSEAERVAEVVTLVRAQCPGARLTVDPVENRGFEYHQGLCFTFFAERVRGELGRGGRYPAGENITPGSGEPATGFTLYLDSILRAIPPPASARRIFVPHGSAAEAGEKLRAEGWITVAGLTPASDAAAEAKRMGCSHALIDGSARVIK
jgi:ATP phosphoribosyltransferase regulatory subunit